MYHTPTIHTVFDTKNWNITNITRFEWYYCCCGGIVCLRYLCNVQSAIDGLTYSTVLVDLFLTAFPRRTPTEKRNKYSPDPTMNRRMGMCNDEKYNAFGVCIIIGYYIIVVTRRLLLTSHTRTLHYDIRTARGQLDFVLISSSLHAFYYYTINDYSH